MPLVGMRLCRENCPVTQGHSSAPRLGLVKIRSLNSELHFRTDKLCGWVSTHTARHLEAQVLLSSRSLQSSSLPWGEGGLLCYRCPLFAVETNPGQIDVVC